MDLNNIHLCLCKMGILKREAGKLVEKNLNKKEFCLSFNGNYYSLLDLKKYKVGTECIKCDEEYIISVEILSEKKLKKTSKIWLDKQKHLLLDELSRNKYNYQTEEEFLSNLPRIEIVAYNLGKIVLYHEQLAVARISEESKEALLFQGNYYDLKIGKKLKTDKDDICPGDIIGYNFLSLNINDFNKTEYKNKMLEISQLITLLYSEVINDSKVFVIR